VNQRQKSFGQVLFAKCLIFKDLSLSPPGRAGFLTLKSADGTAKSRGTSTPKLSLFSMGYAGSLFIAFCLLFWPLGMPLGAS
jgi:hypothetical protein